MEAVAMYTPDPALKGFLNPNDAVAISFWIISIAMVAATVFFLMESMSLAHHWKTSLNVGALVTLIAAVHYFYMREYWVQLGKSPIVYRYIDWSITVPLQMIEFYFILSAVQPNLGSGMFWRLLVGTVAMLAFGYAGETGNIEAIAGFVLGICGWFYILYEIFAGEAGKVATSGGKVGVHVRSSSLLWEAICRSLSTRWGSSAAASSAGPLACRLDCNLPWTGPISWIPWC